MLRYKRNLLLDVFDYEGHKLCSLYDNAIESSGQASNVIVTTQRNGWKTLSFDIPSTCNSEDGEIPNFRLQYLKADYKIRLVDDEGTDWFFVSEPKITHANYSKNVSVTAGHISQLLKTKNLGLEFNDQLGNNVGTAYELLTTILEGTTWKPGVVYNFLEKGSNNPKRRSLRAAAKTGAFKLITQMCELFDAKPVFHGHTRTVDIIPMNPFSIPRGDNLPSIFTGKEENTQQSRAIELHYGQNVSNVTRTLNTDNIVTKLYAYGSWGDTATGYCGIDECKHKEYTLYGTKPPEGGTRVDNPSECTNFRNWQELKFTVIEDDGIPNVYYFRIKRIYGDTAKDVADELSDLGLYVDTEGYVSQANASSYNTTPIPPYLVWSDLDPASRMYVWDTNRAVAYKTYREAETDNPFDLGVYGPGKDQKKTFELVENEFSYLMDYDYYNSVDLLTDEMVQKIAEFQRTAPDFMRMIEKASEIYNEDLEDLSGLVGGVINYCRLPSGPFSFGESDPQYVTVTFDNPEFDNLTTYQVIQETIRKRKWLKDDDQEVDWYHDMIHVATGIRPNGDPVNTNASVMYIVHSDGVWHKTYLKEMYLSADGKKTTIVTWLPKSAFPTKPDTLADAYATSTLNRYYLFEVNNVNGHIGGLEVAIESITDATKTAEDDGTTILHRLFAEQFAPSTESCIGPGFWGWWWKYRTDGNPSRLYFCWGDTTRWTGSNQTSDHPIDQHDTDWYPVYINETDPTPVPEDDAYWYRSRPDEYGTATVRGKLWRKRNGSEWIRIGEIATDDTEYTEGINDEQRKTDQSVLVNHFSTIISSCYSIEQTLKGQYERYRWVVPTYDQAYSPDNPDEADPRMPTGVISRDNKLKVGNYTFETDFNKYWVFTVDEPIPSGWVLSYDTSGSNLISVRHSQTYTHQSLQDLQNLLAEQFKQAYRQEDVDALENKIALIQSKDDPSSEYCESITIEVTDSTLMTMIRDQDAVGYHPSNLVSLAEFQDGKFEIVENQGKQGRGEIKKNARDFRRTSYIPVPPRSKYHDNYLFATTETDPNNLEEFVVFYYDADKKFIQAERVRLGEEGIKSKHLSEVTKTTAYLRIKQIGLDMTKVHITEFLKPKKVQIPGTKQTYNEDRDPVVIFDPNSTSVTVKDGNIDSRGKNLKAVLYVTSTRVSVAGGSNFDVYPPQALDTYKLHVYEVSSDDTSCIRKLQPSSGKASFKTSGEMTENKFLRFVCLKGYEDKFIIRPRQEKHTIVIFTSTGQSVTYNILPKPEGEGLLKGLVPMIGDFADDSDRVYFSDRPYLTALQDQLKAMETDLAETLGDIFREGYWQKNDYVDGDERKLYDDAFENIEHVSKPEASYSVNYLDLYGANEDNLDYGVTPATAKINWPDIKLTDAIHLVDPEIGVNCWAYIDELKKCYDQPWRTTITINTNLTLMNQHSFTDVISYIADVANQARGHETMYERAKQFTRNGRIMAQLLEDTISTERNLITSVQSSWYTDEKGAQMFEATDGTSAMRLTGAGFAIANSKDDDGDWRWRTFGTGNGFTADLITAGHIRATLIEAGTISAEMLTDDVQNIWITLGDELEHTQNDLKAHFQFTNNGLIIQKGTRNEDTGVWTYSGAKARYDSSGIYLYGSSTATNPDVTLDTNGLLIEKGSIQLGKNLLVHGGYNFHVYNNGTMIANSAHLEAAYVEGSIHATELYIDNKQANLSLDSEGKLTANAIATNTFVTPSGLTNTLTNYATISMVPDKISMLTWDSLDNNSGISLEPSKITISSSGTLEIDSTNFKIDSSGSVTISGNVTATTGVIGGYQIQSDGGLLCEVSISDGSAHPLTHTKFGFNPANVTRNNKSTLLYFKNFSDATAQSFYPMVFYRDDDMIANLEQTLLSSRDGNELVFNMKPVTSPSTMTEVLTLHAGGSFGYGIITPKASISHLIVNSNAIINTGLTSGYIETNHFSVKNGESTGLSGLNGRYLVFTYGASQLRCTMWLVCVQAGSTSYAIRISGSNTDATTPSVTVENGQLTITNNHTQNIWAYLLRIGDY